MRRWGRRPKETTPAAGESLEPSVKWDDLPAEPLGQIFSFLARPWLDDLLLRAMASSKRWRSVALSHMQDLTISAVHDGRLVLHASRMGSWSALRTLRLYFPNCIHLVSAFKDKRGFISVTALDLDWLDMSRKQLASVFGGLPQLTALRAHSCFVDTCICLAAKPSIRGRLRSLDLQGPDEDTSEAREQTGLAALKRLTGLETLVITPNGNDDGRLPIWTPMKKLRRLSLADNLEGDSDLLSDKYIAQALASLPALETLCLDTDGVTGVSLRSESLTELSLHTCCSITAEGLAAMTGSLPALQRLAISSPNYYAQMIDEVNYSTQDITDFIVSCRKLVELHLDDFYIQKEGEDDYVIPVLRTFTLAQLRAIDASCTRIEHFVTVFDPPVDPTDEGDTTDLGVFGLVLAHKELLPRLWKALECCEKEELSTDEVMGPLGFAHSSEWVIPSPASNKRSRRADEAMKNPARFRIEPTPAGDGAGAEKAEPEQSFSAATLAWLASHAPGS